MAPARHARCAKAAHWTRTRAELGAHGICAVVAPRRDGSRAPHARPSARARACGLCHAPRAASLRKRALTRGCAPVAAPHGTQPRAPVPRPLAVAPGAARHVPAVLRCARRAASGARRRRVPQRPPAEGSSSRPHARPCRLAPAWLTRCAAADAYSEQHAAGRFNRCVAAPWAAAGAACGTRSPGSAGRAPRRGSPAAPRRRAQRARRVARHEAPRRGAAAALRARGCQGATHVFDARSRRCECAPPGPAAPHAPDARARSAAFAAGWRRAVPRRGCGARRRPQRRHGRGLC